MIDPPLLYARMDDDSRHFDHLFDDRWNWKPHGLLDDELQCARVGDDPRHLDHLFADRRIGRPRNARPHAAARARR